MTMISFVCWRRRGPFAGLDSQLCWSRSGIVLRGRGSDVVKDGSVMLSFSACGAEKVDDIDSGGSGSGGGGHWRVAGDLNWGDGRGLG